VAFYLATADRWLDCYPGGAQDLWCWGTLRQADRQVEEERLVLKGVILDWGGVLMRTVDASGRRKWEAKLGLPLYAVDQVVHGSRSWRQAQSGIISDVEYWADVAAQLGLDEPELDEFRHDYFGGDQLDREMVRLIQVLRPRVKTALLSNASPRLRDLLDELDVTHVFDVIVISGLVGVQKPDPAIYYIVLERLGLAPEETIFVDDFVENIEAARSLGMQTLHFRDGMDWRAELSLRLSRRSGQGATRD
jgi:epoxide hydrolase-like predicted phosphatase